MSLLYNKHQVLEYQDVEPRNDNLHTEVLKLPVAWEIEEKKYGRTSDF